MRTSTSLIVMWKLLSIIETWTTYVISYLNTNNTQCFFDANFITDISSSERMHTLSNLQEATEYSITVSVILNGKKISKEMISSTTQAAGQYFTGHQHIANIIHCV